ATTIKLATSYCRAVGHAADPNCVNPTPPTDPTDPSTDPNHADDHDPVLVTVVNLGSLVGGTLYGESHRIVPSDQAGVRKDESPRFNPSKPGAVDFGTDTITLPYELVDSDSGDPIVTGDKVIYSSGGGEPIQGLVDGQTYYAIVNSTTEVQLAATKCEAIGPGTFPSDDCEGSGGPTPIDLRNTIPSTGKSHSIVLHGSAPAGDASASGPRTIAPVTTSFSGVSVTATNSDDLAAVGISAGFAGTAAVNISGAVDIVTANTSAHIGKSAQINCGATCADNVAAPSAELSVRVAAGNQYYELGIAATLAIGGTAGVGVG